MSELLEQYAQEYAERYAEQYAEKYAEQKVEAARLDNLADSVKNLMESMKLSTEQAISALKISDKDMADIMERL